MRVTGADDPAGPHLQRDADDIPLEVVLSCHRTALTLEPSHERGGQVEPGYTGFQLEVAAIRTGHPASITAREPCACMRFSFGGAGPG